MEPPTKRMRLSLFADQPSDQELDTARYQNDMLLKSRFEAIFEKYSVDFDGIGDEVDLMTGQIVVDNGHLAKMEGEKDIGVLGNLTTPNGKSLLRAMTEAPDTDDPYFNEGADDVIMSIETIAENAGLEEDDEESFEESGDDLFDAIESGASDSQSNQWNRSSSRDQTQLEQSNDIYSADRGLDLDVVTRQRDESPDSLFDVQPNQRMESPDSLFEVEVRSHQQKTGPSWLEGSSDSNMRQSAIEDPTDNNAILAKFGESVGQEVIQLLTTNAEAHIEPAWRIPIKVTNRPVSHSSGHSVPPRLSSGSAPRSEELISPEHTRSIWQMPRPYRKAGSKNIRAESEDPLQEDFSDDRNETPYPDAVVSSSDDDGDGSDFEYGESDIDQREKLISQFICPFCRKQYKTRSSVISHLARYVRKSNEGDMMINNHDVNYIRTRKQYAKKTIRGPRLLVCDFKTMVELHEGAGLTFAEIAQSDVMRTCKSGTRLSDLYDKHRTPPGHDDYTSRAEWTKEEDDLLKQLAAEPLTTMATLIRRLKKHHELEIGDRLANMWLDQLGIGVNPEDSFRTAPERQDHEIAGSRTDLGVKIEDSEDELFGP